MKTPDVEWWLAYDIVARYESWRRDSEGARGEARPSRAEVEDAASKLVARLKSTNDRHFRVMIAQQCRRYFARNLKLPRAFEGFLTDQVLAKQPQPRGPGHPEPALWGRMIVYACGLNVERFRAQGMTLDEACEAASELSSGGFIGRATSPATMRRYWRQWLAEGKANKAE